MLKGKNLTVFIRFGGLNLKKQKGFKSDDSDVTYHSPPASRGLYAMTKIAQEMFLVGSLQTTQKSVFPKDKSKYDNSFTKEQEEEFCKDYDNYRKSKDKVYSLIRKEFVKTDGYIWHHLSEYTDNNEIISRHGSWIKSSIKSWMKSFSKMSLDARLPSNDKYLSINSINNTRGILGYSSKDHCEVFFDEKI